MKMVYSKSHLLHAPQMELDGETSTFYAHHEIPDRAERIMEVLRADDTGAVLPPGNTIRVSWSRYMTRD